MLTRVLQAQQSVQWVRLRGIQAAEASSSISSSSWGEARGGAMVVAGLAVRLLQGRRGVRTRAVFPGGFATRRGDSGAWIPSDQTELRIRPRSAHRLDRL